MNSILLYFLIKMKLTCFSGFTWWMIISIIILFIGIGFVIYTYALLNKDKTKDRDFGLYRGLGIAFTVIGIIMLILIPVIYKSKAETVMNIPCYNNENPKQLELCKCLGAKIIEPPSTIPGGIKFKPVSLL